VNGISASRERIAYPYCTAANLRTRFITPRDQAFDARMRATHGGAGFICAWHFDGETNSAILAIISTKEGKSWLLP
jgi:hypothetical protein